MAWKYNDRIIRVGRSWTDDNGATHPRNWAIWANDEKTAAGLVWEDDPASFDSRFYWDADTPKALDDVTTTDEQGEESTQLGLKSQAIAQTKVTANAKLADTDWMVVKASEIAEYSVPADVLAYRAAVRTASNAIESAISGAANHSAFMALYDTPVDADGNVTGNAPINDWPEEI